MPIYNRLMKRYLSFKYLSIHDIYHHPIQCQTRWFKMLVKHGATTRFGKMLGLTDLMTTDDFRQDIPLQDYNTLKPYILEMMHGQSNVLWPGTIKWYSKSSGTTDDRSKYLPVSSWSLNANHIKGFTCAISMIYNRYGSIGKKANFFSGKSLSMGGSIKPFSSFAESFIGDISAIILYNLPVLGKLFYALDDDIAFLEDWEQKIALTAERLLDEPKVTMFGGVPTWNLVLFRRMLALSGKNNMIEIWPMVHGYIHGGVGFGPYKEQFYKLFPTKDFIYQEIYNASEGFFAIQDDPHRDDMLLMLDHGIYFEFLPLTELTSAHPQTCLLSEVSLYTPYVLVITTNAGLWRYQPGDIIWFTSLDPYRIQITGRTKHYINAFGEELMVYNAEEAMRLTCLEHQAQIVDFTAAPIYFDQQAKAAHEWLVEFIKPPLDIASFVDSLDNNLQILNSDYAAKRYKDLALVKLKLVSLPSGTLSNWMRHHAKLGAQNKIPRLFNTRRYVDDILQSLP